jgi:hypothetical protein
MNLLRKKDPGAGLGGAHLNSIYLGGQYEGDYGSSPSQAKS